SHMTPKELLEWQTNWKKIMKRDSRIYFDITDDVEMNTYNKSKMDKRRDLLKRGFLTLGAQITQFFDTTVTIVITRRSVENIYLLKDTDILSRAKKNYMKVWSYEKAARFLKNLDVDLDHVDGSKFSQEQIGENIVCRVICTTGQIPIRDLSADISQVLKEKRSIKKVWTFGRNPACDYHLGNISRLSNKHFQILLGEDGNLLLNDISTNGTWLNGQKVEKNSNQLLSQGDEITVGVGVESDILSLVIFINDKFKQCLEQNKVDR
uniref:DDK kinase regulatory subunit DBF4,Serine/threonine-protein kinase RAD53 n=1 Tax=Saccharomyces cerevisiae (strain ATCC 204508 / S288c) TaxID=559292 RepID=UPI000864912D|nr:Chain A, DDK kinase regulatory subunit DBF4,Serine/threonine-protein kinase RAD53 [Saccharomyces cerevisiae S288C]5T2S_C Chain C, DDK kinase regulatory subunit DBF4,Serine/threonine-protein kinase RAD53 [Saccharomyces cerevisiae S288C]